MALNYNLENLGDDRFQHLCQALIVREVPGTQCLPTGQADGGRDALARRSHGRSFTVYQCKYSGRPDNVGDIFQAIKRLVEDELPKIRRLIERGLEHYYLITNLSGASRLDHGTVDRVHSYLRETLPIPAECWWRNDINRRLDAAQDVRWAYPEILSGLDVLGLIATVANGDQERQRAQDAMKAYLRQQYDDDREVRFRQVDLRRDLFELFVDVPLRVHAQHNGQAEYRRLESHWRLIVADARGWRQGDPASQVDDINDWDPSQLTGANALLHASTAELFPKLVLEGAPGQGKSTLVQFVCQVHRRRLLYDDDDVPDLVRPFRSVPIRVPFKVDLRDLALWASRLNPFSGTGDTPLPTDLVLSLETFLVAQVHHVSGGARFEVADLHAVMRSGPVLVVLDGLDEVADVTVRRLVVELVTAGASRLREVGRDIQIIVTSRPSAYANSPGLPRDDFRYCVVEALSDRLVLEYARRWSDAKGLPVDERTELLKILNQKRREPHIAELARNPMQLAILLNLINSYGVSLPDKRTAIYDSYVLLYLNREAEKSNAVRTHRELLVDIHRYVAWQLQLQAEAGTGRGAIGRQQLLDMLAQYLIRERRDPGLADVLFHSMLERVFALVQRVEGSYEFEVQPVREYFCAKYLYETAPESPVGNEQSGTVIERFDALARNGYWLNVTRFFAGCFKKGQLSALAQALESMRRCDSYQWLVEPQQLAVYLLRDWVFTQDRISVARVTDLVNTPLGLRLAYVDRRESAYAAPVMLPPECGREELVTEALKVIASDAPEDYARQVAGVLAHHADRQMVSEWWMGRARKINGARLTRWMRIGSELSIFASLPASEASRLLTEGFDRGVRTRMLFECGQRELFNGSISATKDIVDEILDGDDVMMPFMDAHPISELVYEMVVLRLSPLRYAHSTNHSEVLSTVRQNRRNDSSVAPDVGVYLELIGGHTDSFMRMCESGRQRDFVSDLDDWIEGMRNRWGSRLSLWRLASQLVSGAPLHFNSDRNAAPVDLQDGSVRLTKRIAFAASRRSDTRWWRTQIRKVRESDDIRPVGLLLLMFASGSVVAETVDLLDSKIRKCTRSNRRLSLTVQAEDAPGFPLWAADRLDVMQLPHLLSTEVVVAVGQTQPLDISLAMYEKYMSGYRGSDGAAVDFAIASEWALASRGRGRWNDAISRIADLYSRRVGLTGRDGKLNRRLPQGGRYVLPSEIAKQISAAADQFPTPIVRLAQERLVSLQRARTVKVGMVAEQQNW